MNISHQLDLLVSHLDWWMLLLPLPLLTSSLFDVLGWKRLLPKNVVVPFTSMLGFQLGAEAVLQSIPGGFTVTDALKTLLLKRRFSVLPLDSLGSLLIRHWMIGLAQIIYILLAVALALFGEQHLVSSIFEQQTALWTMLGFIVVMSAILGLLVQALLSGTLASSLWRLLRALPVPPLRRWLQVNGASFENADVHFQMMGKKSRWTLISAIGLYLCVWTMDTVETMLAANAMGFPVGFINAFMLEGFLSAVKLAVFFLPSGIGAKDLGYFVAFTSLGVSATTAQIGSFVIIKRMIQLFWIAVGYVILFAHAVRPIMKSDGSGPTIVEIQ